MENRLHNAIACGKAPAVAKIGGDMQLAALLTAA